MRVCIFALRGQMKRSLELELQVAVNHYYECWELNCDPLSESSLHTLPPLRSPLKSLVLRQDLMANFYAEAGLELTFF